MIKTLENDWVCLEEEVKYSVGERKVEAGEENNGLSNNHMDWSHESNGHHLSNALLLELDSCKYIRICRVPYALCSFFQDDRSVGLWKETEEDERGSSDDEADPKRPPPRSDGDKA